jgi:hypothetical protein
VDPLTFLLKADRLTPRADGSYELVLILAPHRETPASQQPSPSPEHIPSGLDELTEATTTQLRDDTPGGNQKDRSGMS